LNGDEIIVSSKLIYLLLGNLGYHITLNSSSSSSSQGETGFTSETHDRTRVFVSNIPLALTWQGLKDHFKVVGEVVYASVSQFPDGASKGSGIVQFETADAADKAIRTMRDFPLLGQTLFVREDVQDRNKRADPSARAADRRQERAADRREERGQERGSSRGQEPRRGVLKAGWQRSEDDTFELSGEASSLIQGYVNEREQLK
jgi:RNA recognition motif-containing protein